MSVRHVVLLLSVTLLPWHGALAPVTAHGLVRGTEPPTVASLQAGPRGEVAISFSEPAAPTSARAEARGAAGRRVSASAARSADRHVGAAEGPLRLAGFPGDLRVLLTITPPRVGFNRFEVKASDRAGPVAADARVCLRLVKLDEALAPAVVPLARQGHGTYAAEGGALALAGWWEVEVVVRRRGRPDVSTVFPLRLGQQEPRASDPDAVRLFDRARSAFAAVRTWREVEQLSDGAGAGYLTWIESSRPDRMRFRTSTGVEVVMIGRERYQRSRPGPWRRWTFSAPVAVEGPLAFMQGTRSITLGRSAPCARERCRVLLWKAPERDYTFAGWVGVESRLIHTVMMVGPFHYMYRRVTEVNTPVQIEPPG